MFNFLESWDPILVDFKRDIDGVINGEVKLWTVAMQTYCERLLKLFNKKEKIYFDNEKISLGSCLKDTYFKEIFQAKTGFHDFNSLKKLNDYGNERKHHTFNADVEKEEIKKWLKRLHTLSLKTYNYLNQQNYFEEFDDNEIEKLLMTSEEEFFDVIEYADNMISRKNEIINKIEDEYLELVALIKDDTEQLVSNEKLIKKLKKKTKNQNKMIMNYKIILGMFDNYIDLISHKDYCIDDIIINFSKSEYEIDDTLKSLIKQLHSQKKDISLLLKNIKTFNSTYINRIPTDRFEDENFAYIGDLGDGAYKSYNGLDEYEVEWLEYNDCED